MRVRLALAAAGVLGAGGLGYAVVADVRSTDAEVDQALTTIGMTERLLNGDILDGKTDLDDYAPTIAKGASIILAIRAAHPFGSIVRADRIGRLEAVYRSMRSKLDQYHQVQ